MVHSVVLTVVCALAAVLLVVAEVHKSKRGRYVMARPAKGKTSDIAFDATLRTAAPFQIRRSEQRKKVAFAIEPSDLQRKVRVRKAANLILFAVDAS